MDFIENFIIHSLNFKKNYNFSFQNRKFVVELNQDRKSGAHYEKNKQNKRSGGGIFR